MAEVAIHPASHVARSSSTNGIGALRRSEIGVRRTALEPQEAEIPMESVDAVSCVQLLVFKNPRQKKAMRHRGVSFCEARGSRRRAVAGEPDDQALRAGSMV